VATGTVTPVHSSDRILAIDAGTTGLTALLVSHEGLITAKGYQEFPQHFPQEGWVEHDLGEMWKATLAATQLALAAHTAEHGSPPRIIAVGITNQRETACFWDRETLGSPRRAIVWQDRRSADICQRLIDSGIENRVREITGLRLDPYFTATKLMWVKENDPHTWAQVVSGRVAIGTVDSYLIARMTRGLEHVSDHTNASRTLLYDLNSGTWSPELLELFDVPEDSLPTIVASYGQIARTDPDVFLGIDAPISGIVGDQQAALVGHAGFTAGDAKCSYGTGSFLLLHTGEKIIHSPHGLLTTVALAHPAESGKSGKFGMARRDFALEGSIFVTGAAVQWLRDGLGIIEKSSDIEELANSVPDSGGVIFVPALTGLGAPDWDPHARGLIIGINRGTTAAHIARATLEGIALEVRDVIDLMTQETGKVLPYLAIDGGASLNNLLCQLQADIAHMLIKRSEQVETTGFGVGLWRNTEEISRLARVSGEFSPKVEREDLHAQWRDAISRSLNWAK
jgi:glycerol kinase